MKKIIWKSNIRIKAGPGESIVSGFENENFLLRRKKGTEIPTMKAKNIVQLKKTGSKSKKKK